MDYFITKCSQMWHINVCKSVCVQFEEHCRVILLLESTKGAHCLVIITISLAISLFC